MNRFMRVLIGIALTGAALTALNRTCPEWVSAVGLDFWRLPELCQECHDASRHHAEQEAQRAPLLARVGTRCKIVEQVADGSISLFEAASAFRELNLQGSGIAVPVRIRQEFADCSDEECLCHQVIEWMEADLGAKGESSRATEVGTRLRAVLRQHQRERTATVLPPCPNP
jgi:hypothetical protein